MYLSAIFIPSNILSKFLSQIPIVAITLIGFSTNDDVDDDEVSSKYSWTEGSVWAIRVFSSFFIVLFAGICYVVMRDYPLNTKVVNQMSEIIDERESDSNMGSAQDRSIETIQPSFVESDSVTVPLLKRDDEIDDNNRQLLLHLSASELLKVRLSDAPKSVIRNVVATTVCCLLGSFVGFGTLITALVIDSQRLDGIFATLLMYLVLLICFLIAYELFRIVAIHRISYWSEDELRRNVRIVNDELNINKKKMAVIEVIKDLNGSNSIRHSNNAVVEVVPTIQELEGHSSTLNGYGFVVLLLLVCYALGAFVILYGFG